MFGYTFKQTAGVWLALLAFEVLIVSMAFGYNSATNSLDLFAGIAAAFDFIGGPGALLTLLGALIVIGVIAWALSYITKTHYADERTRMMHVIVGTIIVLVAIFVASLWLDREVLFSSGLIVLAILVFPTLFTWIITRIMKYPAVGKAGAQAPTRPVTRPTPMNSARGAQSS